jgi:hypothetical protein
MDDDTYLPDAAPTGIKAEPVQGLDPGPKAAGAHRILFRRAEPSM